MGTTASNCSAATATSCPTNSSRRSKPASTKGRAGAPSPAELGRVKRLDDAGGRYIEFVKQSFPRGLRLDGLRIVVDCAHGAAYKVAPTVFWELGAEVFSLGVSPDGLNINRECGALSPEQMRREVLARRADIGIALDGDADRLIIADERGVILDGDQLMALIATGLARGGRLAGGALVATVMSNLGLERFLAGHEHRAAPHRRSATAMSSKRCARSAAISAASSPATSSCRIMRRPATG